MEVFKIDTMKKILIIGPIADFGGRELEAGFIACSLSKKYRVDICSTGVITRNSQVFTFDRDLHVFSINELLCSKYLSLKFFAFLICLKNRSRNNFVNSVNNYISKKFLNYDNKTEFVLENLVTKYDIIFIIAQLTSNFIPTIIKKSEERNIKIIFRTTGTMKIGQYYSFINNVDLFIHHSESNAASLFLENHQYSVVDQCAFNEIELLKIPLLTDRVKTFLALGRLEKEKNFHLVIKAFLDAKKSGDLLYIIGCGSQLLDLQKLANNDESIIFLGYIPNDKLHNYFKLIDCILICSDEEAGPLVGIEAMAAAKIIISTKVGAMPERLNNSNSFWIDSSVKSISQIIQRTQNVDEFSVNQLSKEIRQTYIANFSTTIVSDKYVDIVDNIVSVCE